MIGVHVAVFLAVDAVVVASLPTVRMVSRSTMRLLDIKYFKERYMRVRGLEGRLTLSWH